MPAVTAQQNSGPFSFLFFSNTFLFSQSLRFILLKFGIPAGFASELFGSELLAGGYTVAVHLRPSFLCVALTISLYRKYTMSRMSRRSNPPMQPSQAAMVDQLFQDAGDVHERTSVSQARRLFNEPTTAAPPATTAKQDSAAERREPLPLPWPRGLRDAVVGLFARGLLVELHSLSFFLRHPGWSDSLLFAERVGERYASHDERTARDGGEFFSQIKAFACFISHDRTDDERVCEIHAMLSDTSLWCLRVAGDLLAEEGRAAPRGGASAAAASFKGK
jgi:hypothetical protein